MGDRVKGPEAYADDSFLSVAGCREYEMVLQEVVKYAAKETDPNSPEASTIKSNWHIDIKPGWSKPFYLNSLSVDHSIFAMMCIDGWFEGVGLSKYLFRLSHEAVLDIIKRIEERRGQVQKGSKPRL